METANESYMLHTLEAWFDIYMHEAYNKINTVSLEIPVPEIIVLTDYDSVPKKTIKFGKENLLIRDGYKCAYCQCDLTLDTTTVDHVVPTSKGGKTTWENCTSACKACNHEKADNSPNGKFKPKKHPREPTSVSPLYKFNKKSNLDHIPESWSKFLFR
jgi:5-methylcytosine-specific restriction endonuclease McrA